MTATVQPNPFDTVRGRRSGGSARANYIVTRYLGESPYTRGSIEVYAYSTRSRTAKSKFMTIHEPKILRRAGEGVDVCR